MNTNPNPHLLSALAALAPLRFAFPHAAPEARAHRRPRRYSAPAKALQLSASPTGVASIARSSATRPGASLGGRTRSAPRADVVAEGEVVEAADEGRVDGLLAGPVAPEPVAKLLVVHLRDVGVGRGEPVADRGAGGPGGVAEGASQPRAGGL